jgi:hypothetical protein
MSVSLCLSFTDTEGFTSSKATVRSSNVIFTLLLFLSPPPCLYSGGKVKSVILRSVKG